MSTKGERIQKKREALSINKAELGRRIGTLRGTKPVARQQIGNWESNKHNPRPEMIHPLATVLGTTEEYLIFGIEAKSPAASSDVGVSSFIERRRDATADALWLAVAREALRLSPQQRLNLIKLLQAAEEIIEASKGKLNDATGGTTR